MDDDHSDDAGTPPTIEELSTQLKELKAELVAQKNSTDWVAVTLSVVIVGVITSLAWMAWALWPKP